MKQFYSINQNIETYEDLQKVVQLLCDPLKPYYSDGKALLNIGNTYSRATEKTACLEAFSRPLWGLGPLLAGGGNWDGFDVYITGLINGTNPCHKEYWGDIGDYDQKMVEVAAISLMFIIAKDTTWDRLSEWEQTQFSDWLYRINEHKIPDNNWRFFRVLANLALKKNGKRYSQSSIESDLKRLEDFYLGNGWYQDGEQGQRDYYISFGFHYYSLLYAKLMEEDDVERSKVYKERAILFAKDFIYWFDKEGAAIPYGRSMTYRFAQASFFGALAFAEVEVFSWGVMKGILLRNLRWWLDQYIFSPEGLLTIGYGYPNLIMAENYNAPGSSYWAMKFFIPLALPSDHPFWLAKELPLPELQPTKHLVEAKMIMCRENGGENALLFQAGTIQKSYIAHFAAKYAKFVYSTSFGFNVSKANDSLELGAYDNTLALSERDGYYRCRYECDSYVVKDNVIKSIWKPWDDVTVETFVIASAPWHTRVHTIKTNRKLTMAEGGFSLLKERVDVGITEATIRRDKNSLGVFMPWGASGVRSLKGDLKAELIEAEPNTNLVYPSTVIPTLTGELDIGTHTLISCFFGCTNHENAINEYSNYPSLEAVLCLLELECQK
jgi:hypothetical protein